MGLGTNILWCMWRFRVQIGVILFPLIYLPLPLVIGDQASVAGYILLVMATYWCLDILGIAVVGLIPVFFMPMSGLLSLTETCTYYLEGASMMLTGSVMCAIAIESSDLHRRIALWILTKVGSQPQWLMFGVMIPTFLLSMFINNTSVAAMMLPIVIAIIDQLDPTLHYEREEAPSVHVHNEHDEDGNKTVIVTETCIDGVEGYVNRAFEPRIMMVPDRTTKLEVEVSNTDSGFSDLSKDMAGNLVGNGALPHTGQLDDKADTRSYQSIPPDYEQQQPEQSTSAPQQRDASEEEIQKHKDFGIALIMSICYTANIGGISTLTGTSPNAIFKGFADEKWREHGYAESPINYTTWMVYGIPVAILSFIMWLLWSMIFYIGPKSFYCCKRTEKTDKDRKIEEIVMDAYKKCGDIRFAEVLAGSLFIILILLWFFRAPGFMTGWGDFFEEGYLGDAVPACLIAFICFFAPAELPSLDVHYADRKTKVPVLLTWKSTHNKFPWEIIFLMGGGFSVAAASDASGLSDWIGEQLMVLDVLPNWFMIYVISVLTGILTAIMSNSATTTILMPIMSAMSEGMGHNPLYLMMPATVSASMSFLLPVGTTPNAMCYATGRFTTFDMLKSGFALNLLVGFVVVLATETWAYSYYDYGVIPWAEDSTIEPNTTDIPGLTTDLLL